MFFRRNWSLLIFSLMFGVIALGGDWTNMSGGGVISLSPGEVIPIYSSYKATVDCDEPPQYLYYLPGPLGVYCEGEFSRISDCSRSLSGIIEAYPDANPGSGGWLEAHGGGYAYDPVWIIDVKNYQIPETGPNVPDVLDVNVSPESGEPVNDRDGTFDLEFIDISSEKPNGVNLVRNYRSRERNIYFEDDEDYKNLLLPFSEGGWTHNYVKSIIITEHGGDIYYKMRDGNEIRDVIYIDEGGNGSIDDFANIYKVHRGLVETDNNHWKYIKSDGTIEFYSRSSVLSESALIDSVKQFDETTLHFGYDNDTLKYVIDKWGDSLKFYYKVYCDTVIRNSTEYYTNTPLLDRVEISGRDECIEYKYLRFTDLYGIGLNHPLYRLSQIVKHTAEDSLTVLDRYYYNRSLIPPVDTGIDLKSDIVTQVFPQGEHDEDNDTSQAAYNNHRLSGYRVNNWYGEYPNEGVYYQEVVSGDTILEKIFIERFYGSYHRVDSVWVYHMENLRQLGAHDPNDTEFKPTAPGGGEDYYLEIRRYNAIGTLSSVTTAGKTIKYQNYDTDYNPRRIIEPDGDTVRYAYYTYTVGSKTRYSSYPTKIVYPGKDSVLNFYSRPEPTTNPYYIRLDSTKDEMERKTFYTYDANEYTNEIILDNRYVAGEGTTDVITDYDYNAVGNLLQVEDPEGVLTYYEYSDNNNGPFLLKTGVDVGGDESQNNDILTFYSYNDLGKIEKKIEARVNPSIMDTTLYEYDVMDKLSKITHPSGDYEEFVYDKAGNLMQKKALDTLGNSVITHEYKSYPSGKLREVKENEGAGYTTKYDYNQDGKLVKFINANNKTINYNYKQNKLVSTHYPDGTKDSLGYYPCGCYLQFKEDRNGEVTEYIYDERDRLEKKRYYDDTTDYNDNNPSDSLVYEYNKVGEITKTKDKTGDIIYSRDDVGNLDTVKVYSLYNNVYQYDLSGRKTHFKSYKAGNPSQVYLEQTWQYDDAGRDTSTTAGTRTWNLSYYDNNALKEISYPEISGGSSRLTESYTIGKMGEIDEIFSVLNHDVTGLLTNPGFETGNLNGWKCYPKTGATVWYVDTLQNILEVSCGDTHGTGNPVHSWQVTSSQAKEGTYSLYSPYSPTQPYSDVEFALQHFDLSDYGCPFEASCWVKTNGLVDSVWIGVILWVDYTDSIRVLAHNYSEKITGTNDWEKVTVTIDDEGYDVSDLKGVFYIERMRSNGTVWIDDVKLRKGDAEQNSKITYEYDHRANRNYSYIELPDGTEEEQIYRYDNLSRLKKTVFREPGESPSQIYGYTYDPVGNRTDKTAMGSPSHYEYNYNANNNRLTSISETGENFTYNNRGDLITETGGYTFGYDNEGRLEEIKESTGGLIHKFKFLYSSEGRRIMKIDSSVSAVDTTYYIYDGMFAVAELDGHLDLKEKYIYVNGMLVGRINDDDELYQYFHDGLGSIVMITDTTGSCQNLYTYDDFGNFRHKVENVPNSYCYTGQERDEEPSGLYNLRARYYAAGIGRFTQEDPMFEMNKELTFAGSCMGNPIMSSYVPQDLNRYIYVKNNAVNKTDPLGLFACALTVISKIKREDMDPYDKHCYYFCVVAQICGRAEALMAGYMWEWGEWISPWWPGPGGGTYDSRDLERNKEGIECAEPNKTGKEKELSDCYGCCMKE